MSKEDILTLETRISKFDDFGRCAAKFVRTRRDYRRLTEMRSKKIPFSKKITSIGGERATEFEGDPELRKPLNADRAAKNFATETKRRRSTVRQQETNSTSRPADKSVTCRFQNLDIPRAGRVGALGRVTGRRRPGLFANRTVRLRNNPFSHPPKHRRQVP